MNKLLTMFFVAILIFYFGEESFAQKKIKSKKTSKLIAATNLPATKPIANEGAGSGQGVGTGSGEINSSPPLPANRKISKGMNAELFILSKPRASYTDKARQNQVNGTVSLEITFLASGKIGEIVPVSKLPDGLTESAVDAARQIKFEPQIEKGRAVTVSKIISYNFAIY